MPGTTAILFFTRSNTKQLGRTKRNSRLMHLAMQDHTAGILAKSGMPVIRWDERCQQGASFSERLCHALSVQFQAGWQHLIVVGDDCPQLSLSDLQAAKTALENGQQVIGPDKNGGAYLIGLATHQFDAESFAALPWQQDSLLMALCQWMKEDTSVTLLPSHVDVDTHRQAMLLLSSALLPSALRQLWRQYICSVNHALPDMATLTTTFFFSAHRRGPPAGAC